MKTIIIFDQKNSIAGANGIGYFVDAFTCIFTPISFKVYLIDYYCNKKELEINEQKRVTKISIPATNSYDGLTELLSVYILDIRNSIIFLNYSTLFKLAKPFKEKYETIQIVGIIHSFMWVWAVEGNEKKMYEYITNCTDQNEVSSYVCNLIENDKYHMEYIDKIIALSKDTLNVLKNAYCITKDKLILIPSGKKDVLNKKVSKVEIKTKLQVGSGEKIILYVGRLDRLKGVDILISAFNKLIDKHNNVKLVIVGGGSIPIIQSKMDRIKSKIIFVGHITQKELAEWYNIADIGVISSLSEECSFVGIEMLMHGLPIVATNARGVRNMFHHMENSLTINCRGIKSVFEKEFYEAMSKLLTDEQLVIDLREKARNWYLSHYQFVQMKKQYLLMLDDLWCKK